jgi:hypothetical protein
MCVTCFHICSVRKGPPNGNAPQCTHTTPAKLAHTNDAAAAAVVPTGHNASMAPMRQPMHACCDYRNPMCQPNLQYTSAPRAAASADSAIVSTPHHPAAQQNSAVHTHTYTPTPSTHSNSKLQLHAARPPAAATAVKTTAAAAMVGQLRLRTASLCRLTCVRPAPCRCCSPGSLQ